MSSQNPLVITVTRDPNNESEHLVDVVVSDVTGPVQTWGDSLRAVMARSAIKPLQTLPLVASGAADAFGLTNQQLALASASHSGEQPHLDAVEQWLGTIGGSIDWLECGATKPLGAEAAEAVGADFTALHNCCSGKHAGFLTLAAHLGIEHSGYIGPDHQIQREISRVVEVFTGYSLDGVAPGIDGCGIPTHPIPLANLAQSMARLVNPIGLDPLWQDAAARVVAAASTEPWWMSGTGRHEVLLHADANQPLVCKTGAEGVFMAAIPGSGLGVALKARDGAARAANAAITATLAHLGVITPEASKIAVTNAAGTVVGAVTGELSD